MSKFTPESITLTFYDRNAASFGVTWQTVGCGAPILEYTDENDTEFVRATRVKGKCSDSIKRVKNYAVINGLKPGEKCRYRVGDESGVFSDSAVFRAPDHDPDKLSFLVMTDTQDEDHYGDWWKFAWQEAMERFPETQLLVHAGDIVQSGVDSDDWHLMLSKNADFTRTIPMAPTSGNHDYWYCHYSTDRRFHIDLPPQDTAYGIYYSFDCGPAHFTVISTGDVMVTDRQGLLPEQLEWVKNDIASSDRKWKIVSLHNPMYSPGKWGSRWCTEAVALRRQLDEAFAKYGVDLVVCGHDHVYTRTYPIGIDGLPVTDYAFEMASIDGLEAKVLIDPAGPIHMEPGCAGNQNREVEGDLKEEYARNLEEMSNMTERAVAYAGVVIDGDTMTVSYRENSVDTGECVKHHAFGIRKTSK